MYNPLPRVRSHTVRIPVHDQGFRVTDESGTEVVSQVVAISDQVLGIPGRMSKATHELIFSAKDIPSYGTKTFVVAIADEQRPKTNRIENQAFLFK